MRRVSLLSTACRYSDDDPEGFRGGSFRVRPVVDARETGVSIYELPPGQAVCPYHYELSEEEWVLALAGRPSVRTPDGVEQLEPFDLAFFPKGEGGAHQIRNDTDEIARVVMWSTVAYPSVTAYPDSDKLAVWTGIRENDLFVPRSRGVGYFHGEVEGDVKGP
jgi:uncharacterized cupin superfamily protein